MLIFLIEYTHFDSALLSVPDLSTSAHPAWTLHDLEPLSEARRLMKAVENKVELTPCRALIFSLERSRTVQQQQLVLALELLNKWRRTSTIESHKRPLGAKSTWSREHGPVQAKFTVDNILGPLFRIFARLHLPLRDRYQPERHVTQKQGYFAHGCHLIHLPSR